MFNNVYKNKKVLVTGHTGFKGSWLTIWLQMLGAEVVGLSNKIPTSPSHFEVSGLDKSIKSHFVDVRDYDSVKKVFDEEKPEILFHLAAEAIVRTCYDDPKMAFDTNLGGTVNLLEVLRNSDSVKSAVFITSDKCYENVEWEYGYREDDQLGGKDPYSASKACAELAFSAFYRSYFAGNTKTNIATARAGNVIGGGDWAKDRIVPDCIRSWSESKSVEIRSPYATRPWQLVLEPLSGYLWLAARMLEDATRLDGESFNFGPKGVAEHPVKEIIEEMQKVWTSGEYNIVGDQTNKKEAGLLKLSVDKAQNRLSWQAVLDFNETMEFTARWYKDFYDKGESVVEKITPDHINDYANLAKERGLAWASN